MLLVQCWLQQNPGVKSLSNAHRKGQSCMVERLSCGVAEDTSGAQSGLGAASFGFVLVRAMRRFL